MKKHFTATVILISKTTPPKILLGLHKKLGVWLPPGGHIEDDENPLAAAIRETHEETGIDVRQYLPKEKNLEDRAIALPIPEFFFEETIPAHGEKPEHKHLDLIYVARTPEIEPIFDRNESSAMKWFTKEEALQLDTFPNIETEILKLLSPP
jgi:8-oxo-dGTP pyrophosphatase MutT (NUDIX family)